MITLHPAEPGAVTWFPVFILYLLYDACANPYVIRGYKEISIISKVDMMIKVVIALENGTPVFSANASTTECCFRGR